jgi:hypothetical protein
MKPSGIFLTAEWKHLLMLNYSVSPSILQPFVPAGTEIDSFAGKTYLSLIGFEFNRTRLAGIPVPFHQRFEEVNVRFYVRRDEKRGVVFIRELVPKRAVATIARWVFNENYLRVPMSHRIATRPSGEVASAEFAWGSRSSLCAMNLDTEGPGYIPSEGSLSQFITEHYWGYAAQKDGGCIEYEVQHPRWAVWSAKRAGLSGNAAAHYPEFIAKTLADPPDSAFLARGSSVTIFKGKRIL